MVKNTFPVHLGYIVEIENSKYMGVWIAQQHYLPLEGFLELMKSPVFSLLMKKPPSLRGIAHAEIV